MNDQVAVHSSAHEERPRPAAHVAVANQLAFGLGVHVDVDLFEAVWAGDAGRIQHGEAVSLDALLVRGKSHPLGAKVPITSCDARARPGLACKPVNVVEQLVLGTAAAERRKRGQHWLEIAGRAEQIPLRQRETRASETEDDLVIGAIRAPFA